MMAAIRVILVCLAIKVMLAVGSECRYTFQCPCGSKGRNVTVCVSETSVYTEVCKKLSKCDRCEEGRIVCLKCPEGLEGPLCSRKIRKSRQKRQSGIWYPGRVWGERPRSGSIRSSRNCPTLDSSKLGSIQCDYNSEQQTCTGTCWPGYSFVFESKEEITLTCREGIWTPWPSFPDCKQITDRDTMLEYCPDPGTDPNGVREASRSSSLRGFPQGTRLQFSCKEGYNLNGEQSIFCLASGEWSTDRPRCFPPAPAAYTRLIYCKDPGDISYGNFAQIHCKEGKIERKKRPPKRLEDYPTGSLLKYSCWDGYILEGTSILTCQNTSKWSAAIPTCKYDCGRNSPRRVAPIKPYDIIMRVGEWPWVVLIWVQSGSSSKLVCLGAVIDAETVIAAAHCLSQHATYTLYFGKQYFGIDDNDHEMIIRKSTRVILHPDYRNTTLDADIGLVMFRPRIQYSERVQPICLPKAESTERNIRSEKRGIIVGFGEIENADNLDYMRYGPIPVVNHNACAESYRLQNLPITRDMFCAGYKSKMRSVCSGNIGSPFFFYDSDTDRYTLEGLLSFGVKEQCGVAEKYAVFTKVFNFLPWIIRNSQ